MRLAVGSEEEAGPPKLLSLREETPELALPDRLELLPSRMDCGLVGEAGIGCRGDLRQVAWWNRWSHDTANVGGKEREGFSGTAVQTPTAGSGQDFLSHREVWVAAGFAWTDHLVEQSPLEVWWLSIVCDVGVHRAARPVSVRRQQHQHLSVVSVFVRQRRRADSDG